MFASRAHFALVAGLAVGLAAACSSATGSQGIQRPPSSSATVIRVAAPPDTVIQRAWEVMRNDGTMARWFQRTADDTANVARMESDWIYVPEVLDSAVFGHLTEPEKWIKLLFWAMPERGGTLLYVEALYQPMKLPTEPVQWAAMRPVPSAHPAWQYVQIFGNNLVRRLDSPGEGG